MGTDINDDRISQRTTREARTSGAGGEGKGREALGFSGDDFGGELEVGACLRLKHDLGADGKDTLVSTVTVEDFFVR